MADSKTCKCKETNTNFTQEQMLLLAQLFNKNKHIIKGNFVFGITSKTKGDTFLKAHTIFMFRGRLPATAILGIVCGLVLVT